MPTPPDVLVTDVVMPGRDGISLAAAARGLVPGLAVVLMSGYTDRELPGRGIREGQEVFLTKPYSAAALLHAVRRAASSATRA